MNKEMWKEGLPQYGDTVKFDHFGMPMIGVFERFHDGRALVDVGSRLVYLPVLTEFLIKIEQTK